MIDHQLLVNRCSKTNKLSLTNTMRTGKQNGPEHVKVRSSEVTVMFRASAAWDVAAVNYAVISR